MTVNWAQYEVYDPGVYGPLGTLPRKEARSAFERLMRAKSARIEMLRRLLRASGLEVDESARSIQQLNDWFRANVAGDPTGKWPVLPEWYSVVNDIALFLGDCIIHRQPTLYWAFYTWGRKSAAYQRHVLMGFLPEKPQLRLDMDIDSMVGAYAYRIVQEGDTEPDIFLKFLEIADRRVVTG